MARMLQVCAPSFDAPQMTQTRSAHERAQYMILRLHSHVNEPEHPASADHSLRTQAVDEERLAMLLVAQDKFTLRETSAILILAMSKDAH